MRSIEEDGVWFLPNNPDKKISGRLMFSAEEPPELYLLDQLQEIKLDDTTPPLLEFDIINGYLVDGRKVTLCNCYQSVGIKTGIQTSTVHAKYLIIGHHFKVLKEISLKGVSLRYKNLEDWVDLSNLEIEWSLNNEHNQVKEIKVKQTTLEPIELGKLSDFLLILYDKPVELERLQMASFFGDIVRKVSLEERKFITILAPHEKKLEDIIKVIHLFQELLTFASGQITYPYDIKSGIVVTEKEVRVSELSFEIPKFGEEIKIIEEEKEKLVPIEIYFQVAESEDLDTKFNSQRVLFKFRDVKNQFSELLSLWEQNSKELEPIINLYLRLIYIPRRHINDFFLSLAQAIEAFHTLAHSGIYIDKKVHKNVVHQTLEKAVNSIPDFIPQDNGKENLDLTEYKRVLKEEKLPYLNNFSLKERLAEIINEYKSCLPDSFFESLDEESDFLKKVRKTRDYLTHLFSKQDKSVVFDQDLLALTRKLRILLEVCLLKKLGLKEMDIKKIIGAKNR